MLENYIKQYIKLLSESTKAIMMEPHKIGPRLQSAISPTLRNDKTHLSPEEVIKDLRDKFGQNHMISFVNKYDDDVPGLGINPKSGFATPHGIYSYHFDRNNFSKMLLSQRIRGVDFATDRPYFHIFKITTPNLVRVNPDGSTSKYANEIYDREQYLSDLFNCVKFALKGQIDDKSKIPNRKFINAKNYLSILYKDMFRRERDIARLIYNCYDAVCVKAPDSEKIDEETFFKNIRDYLDKMTTEKKVRGWEVIEAKKPGYLFVKLYASIYLLSYLTPRPKKGVCKSNDPSRFALMLQNIGVSSIIDDGYGLIHHKQPRQAVTINYGGKKADPDEQFSNYELLGTYNNIFHQLSKQDLEDLFVDHATYLH